MIQFREKMGMTLLVAYASNCISQIANQLFFFLILLFLPVEDVGVYSWAIALASIYTYVMDLGFVTFLIGELSSGVYRFGQVLRVILLIRAPVIPLGWVLLQILVWLTKPSPLEYEALCLVGLSYALQLFEMALISWLQVRQRQIAVNIFGLTLPLGRLAGICIPLFYGSTLTLIYIAWLGIIIQAVSTLGYLLLALYDSRRLQALKYDYIQDTRQLMEQFCQRGPKLVVMYLLIALQARLDWLLVSSFLSKSALGNYSLANKILELIMLLASIAAKTTFPWLSRRDAYGLQLESRLALIRRIFVVTSVLLCAALFFSSMTLLRLLFAHKYAGAEGALQILILVGGMFMINQYHFYWLLARKLEREYTGIIFMATIFQLCFDAIMIPRLGIEGAALGMVVMGLILHFGQNQLLLRKKLLNKSEVFGLIIFLFTSICILLIVRTLHVRFILKAIISMIFVGLFGVYVILRREDFAQIWEWKNKTRRALLRYSKKLPLSGGY